MATDDIVIAWLIKAEHDLETAKIISINLPEYDDMIAFHCQQSIEKALKAYLVFLDIEFKPVHDLGYLLNLISTKDTLLDNYYDQTVRVSMFAVQIRYPDQIIKLTQDQVRQALDLADLIFNLIKSQVK